MAQTNKCPICHKEVKQNPCVTKDAKCTVCNMKLDVAK